MVDRKQGIERSERVRKREDFIRLFKSGTGYHSPQYTLVVVENGLGLLRFAILVSKKIGSAVVRNYEKRLCREVFRREKEKLRTGYDFLMIVKCPTDDFKKSSEQLKDLLVKAFGSISTECVI
ncbi:MAG: ribonuclease P protein component [Spirochaetota bacterium]